jgi:hypothetical protein
MSRMEFLKTKLSEYGLEVLSESGKLIHLKNGYTIEFEKINLFKLIHEGHVVAPFDDVDELCNFIKMDMQLHGEN